MEHGGRAGAVLSPGSYSIRTVEETGSTNADLAALALGGAAEGTWLRAERQSAGRGRQGRLWVSPTGNLYASTLVRRRSGDPPIPTLALVAAVALHEAVSVFVASSALVAGVVGYSPSPREAEGAQHLKDERGALAIKWPNDLLLGHAKLSGILLEGAGDAVIAGFGVNVAHHPDLADRRTTSLATHGVAVAPATLLDVLTQAFARWLGTWRGQGLDPVRAAWLHRAHPLGTALTVRLPDGGAIDGLFDGLDPAGALLLRSGGGERRVIHAADVFLV